MEKKIVLPNEASWLRWLCAALLGLVIGSFIAVPWELLSMINPWFINEGVIGEMKESITLLNQFVGFFIGTAIAIRVIAKTKLRDFIFGINGKNDKKQNLLVLGLYLLGMLCSALPFIGNITLRADLLTSTYLVSFALLLAFLWMQTSWEEFVFRGIFIRLACKNNISNTTKAVICGVVSSLVFMAMHFANPEILHQKDAFQLVLACLPYFLSGMGLYFVNIYFKSLMPGLIIHWINNFVNFALLTSVVSVGGFPSLFVDNTPPTGLYYLITTLLCYAPIYIYILVNILKKRKAGKLAA